MFRQLKLFQIKNYLMIKFVYIFCRPVLVIGLIWKAPFFVSKGAKKRPNFFLPKNDPPYTFYCIFITFLCDNFSQINSKLQKIIYFYNFPGQFFKIGLKYRKKT